MELNAVHVDAVSALLEALDKIATDTGTHVRGLANFVVYDEAGEELQLNVSYTGGAHVLVV